MARSGSAREALRRDGETLIVRIWAHPGSDTDSIDRIDPFRNALVIRVKARAIEGAANESIVRILSETLGCRVVLEAGHTSRGKTLIAYTDLTPDEALDLLLGKGFQ